MKKVITIAKPGKYKKVRVEFVHMDLYPRNFQIEFRRIFESESIFAFIDPKIYCEAIYCVSKITHLLLFVAGLVTVRARTF